MVKKGKGGGRGETEPKVPIPNESRLQSGDIPSGSLFLENGRRRGSAARVKRPGKRGRRGPKTYREKGEEMGNGRSFELSKKKTKT